MRRGDGVIVRRRDRKELIERDGERRGKRREEGNLNIGREEK